MYCLSEKIAVDILNYSVYNMIPACAAEEID
jgi:hypothetical protein